MKRDEMLGKAIVIAANAHAGQYDKGGKPYILHCLAVLNLVESDDEEIRCIAVLHDVIEDTKTTYSELSEAGMSERVIKGISILTKMLGQTYDEYKQAVFSSTDAMIVKKADLTHNSDIRRLKGISEKDIARMTKYHQFYLEIVNRLEDAKRLV